MIPLLFLAAVHRFPLRKLHGHWFYAGIRVGRCQRLEYGAVWVLRTERLQFIAVYLFDAAVRDIRPCNSFLLRPAVR